MSPELWLPVFTGPLDDLVDRIHRRIEQFAEEAGVEKAFVEVELVDGARYTVESLAPEPGYGFVTHPAALPRTTRPAERDRPGRLDQAHRARASRRAAARGVGFSVPEARR